MNLSPADTQDMRFRSPSHGQLLVLVAVIVVAVPLIVIGWVSSLLEEATGLVSCRGSIRVNGQALTSGKVLTRRESATSDESSSIGSIDALGKFQLSTDGRPGAPVGHHRVTVLADGGTGGVEIPEDYKSLETTKLAIDIQPESRFNIFTLNITADD